MASVKKRKVAMKRAKPKAVAAGGAINAWQDDPASSWPVIDRPVPDLSAPPLRFKIKGPVVKPGKYAQGTSQFRYWTAAEALRRGGDFWAPLLGVTRWQPGAVLPVGLDEGVQFNAYYNRQELAFFHDSAGGQVYYSGESPDIVCHEMGHACLDAHRPELFDAPFIEAGAFHESFGDTSAILSALQLKSVRLAALSSVAQHRPSSLSRLAEQLGAAIRQTAPDAVDPDCLRNAWNSFTYVDPQTLPDLAPASQLCAEVHSFSRVFTGAFYDILSGMLQTGKGTPTEADLAGVATDYARLLVEATAAAPIQPDYFAQIASHMIDADTTQFAGKYRSALTTTFVSRGIIPKSAVAPLLAFKGKLPSTRGSVFGIAALARDRTARPLTHRVQLDGQEFGFGDRRLIVRAPVEEKPLLMVSAAVLRGTENPTAKIEMATHRFVRGLFAHGRVDTESRTRQLGVSVNRTSDQPAKTHALLESSDGLTLVRRLFDCGHGC